MEDAAVLGRWLDSVPPNAGDAPTVRCALVILLLAACSTPPRDEGPPPPEVTLHDVRLRSYRGSTLAATGHADLMTYERASADVLARGGTFDVFRLEAPRPAGAPPPVTRIEAAEALGNLLSRGIDASGGVVLRTPSGLVGRTSRATFDSPTLRAHGTEPITVTGPNGYWLEASGFELSLRDDVYVFSRMKSRVNAL